MQTPCPVSPALKVDIVEEMQVTPVYVTSPGEPDCLGVDVALSSGRGGGFISSTDTIDTNGRIDLFLSTTLAKLKQYVHSLTPTQGPAHSHQTVQSRFGNVRGACLRQGIFQIPRGGGANVLPPLKETLILREKSLCWPFLRQAPLQYTSYSLRGVRQHLEVCGTGSGCVKKPLLHHIPLSRPLQILGIDVMDLLQGNRHVEVIQDLFTEWPMAIAVSDQKRARIVRRIAIPVFGVPEYDCRTNLSSNFMANICNTTAYDL